MATLGNLLPNLCTSPKEGLQKHSASQGVSRSFLEQWKRTKHSSTLFRFNASKKHKSLEKRYQRSLCRAQLPQDAPFVIAIGVCILSSFALVNHGHEQVKGSEKSPENSALGANDVRYGVMTVISFIPLFNWLGWVFAWLDTNDQRYLFYAIVYLAPYIRIGFSLSPDDSWLPIASLVACIAHVQLEINLNTSGELGNESLRSALKQIYSKVRIKELEEVTKRPTEPLHPKVNEPELPADEEYSERELLEFDKKLSSLEELPEEEKQSFEK